MYGRVVMAELSAQTLRFAKVALRLVTRATPATQIGISTIAITDGAVTTSSAAAMIVTDLSARRLSAHMCRYKRGALLVFDRDRLSSRTVEYGSITQGTFESYLGLGDIGTHRQPASAVNNLPAVTVAVTTTSVSVSTTSTTNGLPSGQGWSKTILSPPSAGCVAERIGT